LFVFCCFKRLRIDLGFTFPQQKSTVEFSFTARNDIWRNFDDPDVGHSTISAIAVVGATANP
jgi:hypothetical protein